MEGNKKTGCPRTSYPLFIKHFKNYFIMKELQKTNLYFQYVKTVKYWDIESKGRQIDYYWTNR